MFQAVAGEKQSHGATPGAALDALTAQLTQDETGTIVIVQRFRPDKFFTEADQRRLAELLELRRAALGRGASLVDAEEAELKHLVEAELKASAARAAALADGLGR